MEVVVSSIRHTGTWFTIRLFTQAGMKEASLVGKREDNCLYHGHMEKETQIKPALERAKHMPLVIPLRHPYRVEESWKARAQHTLTQEWMLECWAVLFGRMLPANPHILPIDSPRRDEALDSLSKATGLNLSTDWLPINSKKETHSLPWEELQPSDAVKDMMRDNIAFFSRYYPSCQLPATDSAEPQDKS